MKNLFYVFCLLFTCFCQKSLSTSVKNFLNVPDNTCQGEKITIAVVESCFNPELHDSDKVLNCYDIDKGTLYDPTNDERDFKNKFEEELQSIVRNLDSSIRTQRTSGFSVGNRGRISFEIGLHTIRNQISMTDVDSEIVRRKIYNYKLSFDSEEGNTSHVGENLSTDQFRLFFQNDATTLHEKALEILKNQKYADFIGKQGHGDDVISCIQHIAPEATIKVFNLDQLPQIASDETIDIVNLSTNIGIQISPWVENTHSNNSLDRFTGIVYEELLNRFSCFKDTSKTLLIALDNEHEPFNKRIFNRASLQLAQHAEENGFHILLCSACSLEETILGSSSYVGDETKNLNEILKYYVTSPGYVIPFESGNRHITGTSFATPYASGVLALVLSQYNHLSPTDLVRCVTNAGRKKEMGLTFIPAASEKKDFIGATMKAHSEFESYIFEKMKDVLGEDANIDFIENGNHQALQNIIDSKEDLRVINFYYNLSLEFMIHIFNQLKDQDGHVTFFWNDSTIIRDHVFHELEVNRMHKYWNHLDYGKIIESIENS